MSSLHIDDFIKKVGEVLGENLKKDTSPEVAAAMKEHAQVISVFAWMALGRILTEKGLKITSEFPINVGNGITTTNG